MDGIAVGQPGVFDVAALEPFIWGMPAAEQHSAMLLMFQLLQLNAYTNQFNAAVALLGLVEMQTDALPQSTTRTIDETRNRHVLKLWCEMAGRDAAITVFHFGKTLGFVRRSLDKMPSICSGVNFVELREVSKQFHRSFPDFEMMRHAVGHSAEAVASLDVLKAHSCDGVFIFGKMSGRIYTLTFEGAHRSLEVTRSTCGLLADYTNRVYAAFPQVVDTLPTARG